MFSFTSKNSRQEIDEVVKIAEFLDVRLGAYLNLVARARGLFKGGL
jgi:hypothetical protein